MPAPFKRGAKLIYTCPVHGTTTEVKYVKWWGSMRPTLVVVEFTDTIRKTVHVTELKPKEESK